MGKEGISTKQDRERNRSTNRYRSKNRDDRKTPYKKESFKGETAGMSGHVFQCHSEQRVKGEFDETMGALKTFASTKYVSYIDYLTPIFVDISEPTLVKPKLSNTEETVTLKDGSERTFRSSTTEELEEFRIKLKEFLKDPHKVNQPFYIFSKKPASINNNHEKRPLNSCEKCHPMKPDIDRLLKHSLFCTKQSSVENNAA